MFCCMGVIPHTEPDTAEALKESSRQLEEAQRIAHLGHYEQDLDTGIIRMSAENFRILGLEPAESVTKEEGSRFIHPDDVGFVMQAYEEALRTGIFSLDHRIVRTDGESRFVHAEGRVVFDDTGRPRRMFGTLQDVTERRRTEQLLHVREQEFRAIVEGNPDHIIRYDRDFRRLYVNPAVCKAYGMPAEALLGQVVGTGVQDARIAVIPSQVERIRTNLARVIETGERLDDEVVFPMPEGRRAYHVRYWPEFDHAGAVASVLAIASDVTAALESKEARQQADEARRQLLGEVMRAREEERATLARELHDEVGQQVTALLLGLQVLSRAKTVREARPQAGQLREVAAQTVESLRRLAHGLHPLALDQFGVASAIELAAKDYTAAFGIPVELDVQAFRQVRLPKAVEIALYRMCKEALTNVARHTEATGASVSLRLEGSDVVLEIRDDGAGFVVSEVLDSANPARAFGLRGIVESAGLLGGSARIDSAPGRGTTILVTVPYAGNPEGRPSWPPIQLSGRL